MRFRWAIGAMFWLLRRISEHGGDEATKKKSEKGQLASARVEDDRLQQSKRGSDADAEGELVSTQLGTSLVANITMPLTYVIRVGVGWGSRCSSCFSASLLHGSGLCLACYILVPNALCFARSSEPSPDQLSRGVEHNGLLVTAPTAPKLPNCTRRRTKVGSTHLSPTAETGIPSHGRRLLLPILHPHSMQSGENKTSFSG